ncbi:hypothetical protein JFL43_03460 [Viridibacillus sp. YIM B01967]|uniref:Macro domain-containing protein n=1 Tax=Viridibacillus soli TaxID=2798301 RepID=A0ABS1H3D4_9BACL|nr:hypothetical protein [Viridibacillus soli]MBK3493929.1 hypothetical protein [Viridibacillus soli]
MGLFPEDSGSFDYEKNEYLIDSKINVGNITGARINSKYDRAIAVSLIHGNTATKCAGSLKECHDIAVKARTIYLNHFCTSFPVSAKAMAWEIYLHAVPEVLDEVFNNKIVRVILGSTLASKVTMALTKVAASHTDYADIGINDNLRSFDSSFEQAYDLVY